MAAPGRGRWITVRELAEYAYCPRAWWYSAHPPEEGPDPESARSALAGQSAHERALGAVARRDRDEWVYWAALGVALLVLVGGILWLSM